MAMRNNKRDSSGDLRKYRPLRYSPTPAENHTHTHDDYVENTT